MPLSRADETELLTVLYDGLHETPPWSSFLHRLLRRLGADRISLIFGRGESPDRSAPQFDAARYGEEEQRRVARSAMIDLLQDRKLRPGRVYDSDEISDPRASAAGRFMRVAEPGGLSAWLAITGREGAFGAADSALLSSLAPHLVTMLKLYAVMERASLKLAISEDALARAGVGWEAVDELGRSVERGGLRGPTDAKSFLVPPPRNTPLAPVGVRLMRARPDLGVGAIKGLKNQFGLSHGEARLAVLLANGRSLIHAAEDLGLTIETARSYSKSVFAKTGTSGQPQLVRLVLTGPASLANANDLDVKRSPRPSRPRPALDGAADP